MVCYLNIGNTHTQILTVSESGERSLRTIATAEFTPEQIPKGMPVVAACVVSEWQHTLADAGVRLLHYSMTDLDFSMCDPTTIGADRLANANKLVCNGVLPAVSVDFGTAITAEIVDDQKRFRGGFIAPGRALMRHALHTFTSRLPDVPISQNCPDFPGTNTADAMRVGTDLAAIEFVRGLVARVGTMFPGKTVRFVACGGDRGFFLNALRNIEDGGDCFTLDGLASIQLTEERI